MSHTIALRDCSSSWLLSGFPDEAFDDFAGQIELTRSAGLSRLDLRGIGGKNVVELPLDEARRCRELLDEAGLTVGMFGTPIGKLDIEDDLQADLDRLDHIAELADVFECRQVRVFSYYNRAEVDKAAWREECLRRLGLLKDRAAAANLTLYHENERGIYGDRCADVIEILDALHDGQVFKSIFDFDNFNQSGEDVWECWEALRDRTDAFHLKDSDKDCQHVPIGQGASQAARIFADALERGFAGPLSLEPHLAHSPAVMATHASGKANQALKDMSPQEVWLLAAEAAKQLLGGIKAPVV